jgi:hypothetical protein
MGWTSPLQSRISLVCSTLQIEDEHENGNARIRQRPRQRFHGRLPTPDDKVEENEDDSTKFSTKFTTKVPRRFKGPVGFPPS